MKSLVGFNLCFFAFAIFISQSLMDLASFLLLVSVLIYGFKLPDRRGFFKPTIFDYIFVVWVTVIILGLTIKAPSDAPVFKKVFEFKWIFNFYSIYWALRVIGIRDSFLKAFHWFVLITSIYSISVFFLKFDILRPSSKFSYMAGGVRVGGLYADYMTYAHGYGMLFCLYFGLSLSYLINQKKSWIIFLNCALLAVTLLLSFTRGAWIGLGIATLAMTYFIKPKWGHILLALGLVFFVSLYSTWSGFRERINFAFNYSENHDSERVTLWKTNLHIFKQSPLIGIGYGENKRLLRTYFDELGVPQGHFEGHAHNQYIHFLAGTGILGLIMYLGFLFQFFKSTIISLRAMKDKHQMNNENFAFNFGLALGLLGVWFTFIFGGLTESNFEHSKIKYILIMFLSLSIYINDWVSKNRSTE